MHLFCHGANHHNSNSSHFNSSSRLLNYQKQRKYKQDFIKYKKFKYGSSAVATVNASNALVTTPTRTIPVPVPATVPVSRRNFQNQNPNHHYRHFSQQESPSSIYLPSFLNNSNNNSAFNSTNSNPINTNFNFDDDQYRHQQSPPPSTSHEKLSEETETEPSRRSRVNISSAENNTNAPSGIFSIPFEIIEAEDILFWGCPPHKKPFISDLFHFSNSNGANFISKPNSQSCFNNDNDISNQYQYHKESENDHKIQNEDLGNGNAVNQCEHQPEKIQFIDHHNNVCFHKAPSDSKLDKIGIQTTATTSNVPFLNAPLLIPISLSTDSVDETSNDNNNDTDTTDENYCSCSRCHYIQNQHSPCPCAACQNFRRYNSFFNLDVEDHLRVGEDFDFNYSNNGNKYHSSRNCFDPFIAIDIENDNIYNNIGNENLEPPSASGSKSNPTLNLTWSNVNPFKIILDDHDNDDNNLHYNLGGESDQDQDHEITDEEPSFSDLHDIFMSGTSMYNNNHSRKRGSTRTCNFQSSHHLHRDSSTSSCKIFDLPEADDKAIVVIRPTTKAPVRCQYEHDYDYGRPFPSVSSSIYETPDKIVQDYFYTDEKVPFNSNPMTSDIERRCKSYSAKFLKSSRRPSIVEITEVSPTTSATSNSTRCGGSLCERGRLKSSDSESKRRPFSTHTNSCTDTNAAGAGSDEAVLVTKESSNSVLKSARIKQEIFSNSILEDENQNSQNCSFSKIAKDNENGGDISHIGNRNLIWNSLPSVNTTVLNYSEDASEGHQDCLQCCHRRAISVAITQQYKPDDHTSSQSITKSREKEKPIQNKLVLGSSPSPSPSSTLFPRPDLLDEGKSKELLELFTRMLVIDSSTRISSVWEVGSVLKRSRSTSSVPSAASSLLSFSPVESFASEVEINMHPEPIDLLEENESRKSVMSISETIKSCSSNLVQQLKEIASPTDSVDGENVPMNKFYPPPTPLLSYYQKRDPNKNERSSLNLGYELNTKVSNKKSGKSSASSSNQQIKTNPDNKSKNIITNSSQQHNFVSATKLLEKKQKGGSRPCPEISNCNSIFLKIPKEGGCVDVDEVNTGAHVKSARNLQQKLNMSIDDAKNSSGSTERGPAQPSHSILKKGCQDTNSINEANIPRRTNVNAKALRISSVTLKQNSESELLEFGELNFPPKPTMKISATTDGKDDDKNGERFAVATSLEPSLAILQKESSHSRKNEDQGKLLAYLVSTSTEKPLSIPQIDKSHSIKSILKSSSSKCHSQKHPELDVDHCSINSKKSKSTLNRTSSVSVSVGIRRRNLVEDWGYWDNLNNNHHSDLKSKCSCNISSRKKEVVNKKGSQFTNTSVEIISELEFLREIKTSYCSRDRNRNRESSRSLIPSSTTTATATSRSQHPQKQDQKQIARSRATNNMIESPISNSIRRATNLETTDKSSSDGFFVAKKGVRYKSCSPPRVKRIARQENVSVAEWKKYSSINSESQLTTPNSNPSTTTYDANSLNVVTTKKYCSSSKTKTTTVKRRETLWQKMRRYFFGCDSRRGKSSESLEDSSSAHNREESDPDRNKLSMTLFERIIIWWRRKTHHQVAVHVRHQDSLELIRVKRQKWLREMHEFCEDCKTVNVNVRARERNRKREQDRDRIQNKKFDNQQNQHRSRHNRSKAKKEKNFPERENNYSTALAKAKIVSSDGCVVIVDTNKDNLDILNGNKPKEKDPSKKLNTPVKGILKNGGARVKLKFVEEENKGQASRSRAKNSHKHKTRTKPRRSKEFKNS